MKDLIAIGIWLTITFGTIACWINHLIICLRNDDLVFLIVGAIIAPVAVIHGLGGFLGLWG